MKLKSGARGGKLASVTDEEGYNFINSKKIQRWIGGISEPGNDTWVWTDCSPWGFTRWTGGEPKPEAPDGHDKEKCVVQNAHMSHSSQKNGLLRNAQTRKDLSVVQQYVQVKHKVIDFIVQSLCWSQLQMMFLLFKMSLSAAHTTAHQAAILGGRCSMESATSGAAAELKCRSINSHLTSVTTKKIHDYLKQDVSENYVFMKSLNIAGEDPIWYLDWRNRPIPRG